MYYLKASASFDSAHFLAGYEGKCANLHGHHWVIEVETGGEELHQTGTERGMLTDFGNIKKCVRQLAESFDHALIYEEGSLKQTTLDALADEGFRIIPIDCRPTAENLARMFFEKLKQSDMPVTAVTVYETPDNCAVYKETP